MVSVLVKLILSISSFAGEALQLQVEGSINPGSADYIISNLQAANEQKSAALIVKLNTPGGLLTSTRSIIQAINSSQVPVVVYVTPSGGSATSAGALIALSAHKVAMSPGTNMGAAHPVSADGKGPEGAMEGKVVQDTSALSRSQAQLRGRNVAVAEEIVTKSLSLSAEEALQKKVIEWFVKSDEELLKKLKETYQVETIRQVPMNTKQTFLHVIADPNVSTLLLSLAGIAIYTEVSSGFSLIAPGVFGILMLILGFVSLQMLPISTGGVMFMGLGLILLISEIFITSFGLLSIAGLAALFAGSLLLIDPAQMSLGVSPYLIGSLMLSASSIIGLFGYIVWRDGRVKVHTGLDGYVGARAVVESAADPAAGVILINGELWNYKSDRPLKVGQIVYIKKFNSDHFIVSDLE